MDENLFVKLCLTLLTLFYEIMIAHGADVEGFGLSNDACNRRHSPTTKFGLANRRRLDGKMDDYAGDQPGEPGSLDGNTNGGNTRARRASCSDKVGGAIK